MPSLQRTLPRGGSAVAADRDIPAVQHAGECHAGELAALVGVEYPRRPEAPQSFLQRPDAEISLQRDRQPPSQHPPAAAQPAARRCGRSSFCARQQPRPAEHPGQKSFTSVSLPVLACNVFPLSHRTRPGPAPGFPGVIPGGECRVAPLSGKWAGRCGRRGRYLNERVLKRGREWPITTRKTMTNR